MGPRPVVLGRNASICDVRFPCHSVSNKHAKIHFYDGSFYVTDCKSSNGTHIFMRRPTVIEPNEEHIFRIGGTTIKLKREGSMMLAKLNPTTKFLTSTSDDTNSSAEENSGHDEGESVSASTIMETFQFANKIHGKGDVTSSSAIDQLTLRMIPTGSIYFNMLQDEIHGDGDYSGGDTSRLSKPVDVN